jgi:hypothetical protein
MADDDPDLAHLFELLSMLPGPTQNGEFWTAVNQRVTGDKGPLATSTRR